MCMNASHAIMPSNEFCTDSFYIPGHTYNRTDYPDSLPGFPLWSVVDCMLVVVIVLGNVLTITAVRSNRNLSDALSNQFILNLAMSDFFLGLTLPYHMAFYICSGLGHQKATCLLRFVLIAFVCTASVYNLIAIAVDRYIAVVHPLRYCTIMTEWRVNMIIACGWMLAFVIGTVPVYWNTWHDAVVCELDEVLHKYYLSAILLPAFLLIWLAMFIVYWRIWREATGVVKRMRTNLGDGENPTDRKSVQVVLLVLGCFSVCWLPFFIVAIARVFDLFRTPQAILVYRATFSLAMANSGMNPIIYAWKNAEFKQTFVRILHCRPANEPFKPDKLSSRCSVADHEPIKTRLASTHDVRVEVREEESST